MNKPVMRALAILAAVLLTMFTVTSLSGSQIVLGHKQNNYNKDVEHLIIPESRLVPIMGEIDNKAFESAEKIRSLDDGITPIYVVLFSPGGSVLSGSAVVAAIEASRSPVITICATMCASMAAIIFEYGTERYMVNHSVLMLHQASGGLEGDLQRMQSQLAAIIQLTDEHFDYIADRVGISRNEFQKRVANQIWLTSLQAVDSEFADGLTIFSIEKDQ